MLAGWLQVPLLGVRCTVLLLLQVLLLARWGVLLLLVGGGGGWDGGRGRCADAAGGCWSGVGCGGPAHRRSCRVGHKRVIGAGGLTGVGFEGFFGGRGEGMVGGRAWLSHRGCKLGQQEQVPDESSGVTRGSGLRELEG